MIFNDYDNPYGKKNCKISVLILLKSTRFNLFEELGGLGTIVKNFVNDPIIINSPSPAISKMWSAFLEHLKLLEIYM